MLGTFSSFTLCILAAMSIFPVIKHTTSAEATVIPSTTTLAITTGKDTASVDITPTSSTGTFATSDSANEAAFTVTTNNLTGYSLNLIGSGSDTTGRLVNNDDSTYYLDTLTSDVDETTFRTGNAATYNNKWGYKLTINNTSSNNFLSAPTTNTKTIHTTSCANNTTACPTSQDSYALGIGVRADYDNPVGTYTNTFVLTAVGNPVPYEINYKDSTGTGGTTGEDVSNLPATESAADITASAFTLSTTVPTRTGYQFIGWCDGTVTHVVDGESTCAAPAANSNDTGDGTIYQPGASYTFSNLSSSSTNIANLYAMWKKSAGYIQDFTHTMCSDTASLSPVTLKDRRDDNEYTVRYINGNCWMVQNLRYVGDAGSTSSSMIMKADTSNIASDQTLTIGDLTSGDDYDNARIHVATADQVPSGLTLNDIGVWYNYAAASAGTITGSSNTSTQIYDICPKGWRLPTNSEQSGITSYKDAFSPVTGGIYNNGTLNATGYGYWWSATSGGSTVRYLLYYDGSSLGTGGYGNRYSGSYVRCIRNTSSVTITFNGNGATGGSMDNQVINASGTGNPSGTLNANQFTRDGYYFAGWNTQPDGSGTSYANGATYTASTTGDTTVTLYAQWFDGPTMQDFTATMCSNVASSNPVQVMDRRDGEIYYVQKLADGNCWLLENLRLDPTEVSLDDLKGNTNATDQILTYFKNGGGSSPYTNYAVANWASSNYYNRPLVATSGTGDQGDWDKNTVIATSGSSPAGKVGVYYNYCAASAGSYCYASNAGSGNASYDICPAGWHMPTGNTANGSYYYLYNTGYSANVANFQAALSTSLSGKFYSGSADQGSNGFFWSSSRYTNTYMYYLRVNQSSVSRQDSNNSRDYGISVRCVRNTSSVTITFNGNGATGGSMDTQVIGGVNTSGYPTGTLDVNQFTRDGYYFAGWNTQPDGSGTSYDNGAIYTASTTGDISVTLYAQWLDSSRIMQDFTATTCSSIASSNPVQVVDRRDDNVYTVRYINGNCWMTQNLRYVGDAGSSSTSMIMKSATSNIASDQTLTIGDLTSGNDYNNARIHVATANQVPSGATYTATDMGVWYNYAAASAGFVTSNQNASTESTYSVCPAGWRLPTNSEQSGITSYASQYSAVTGGLYSNGRVDSKGFGLWWSSTPNPSYNTNRYLLVYDGSSLSINYYDRYYGYYVRCIRSS